MTQKVFVSVGIPLNQDEIKRARKLLDSNTKGVFQGYIPILISNSAASTNYLCFDVWDDYEHDFQLIGKFPLLTNLDEGIKAAQTVATRFNFSTNHQLVVYIDESLSPINLEFIFGLVYRFPGAAGDVTASCLRSHGIPVKDVLSIEYVGGAGLGVFKFFTKALLNDICLYGGWTWTREEIEAVKMDWDLYLPHGSEGGPKGGTECLAMFEVVKSGTPVQDFRSLILRIQDVMQDVSQRLTGTFEMAQAGIVLWFRNNSRGEVPVPPIIYGQEVFKRNKPVQDARLSPPIPSQNRQVGKNIFTEGFQIKKKACNRDNRSSDVK